MIIFCDILCGRQMVFLGWLKTTGKGQVSPDQKILSVKLHLQFLVLAPCYKSQNCDWLLIPLANKNLGFGQCPCGEVFVVVSVFIFVTVFVFVFVFALVKSLDAVNVH